MRTGNRIATFLAAAAIIVVPVFAFGGRSAKRPPSHGRSAASATASASVARPGSSASKTKPEATASAAPAASSATSARESTPPRSAQPSRGRGNRRTRAKPRRRWRPQVTPGYRKMVEAWHGPVQTPPPTDDRGRPHLVLEVLNTGERLSAPAHRDDGGFRGYDVDRLAHQLRDTRTGNEFPVDPELLDLVYQVQTHFKAGAIRVISAYRTRKTTGASNHGRGRAIDIVVPGAKDEDVAAFVRSRGFVGVGLYPTSGFVHVDVRPESYYWIDRSGPGQANREQGTLAREAALNDSRAASGGRKPALRWAEPSNDIAGAFGGGVAPSSQPAEAEDQEDDLEEDP